MHALLQELCARDDFPNAEHAHAALLQLLGDAKIGNISSN
jgi:hypothetical protein